MTPSDDPASSEAALGADLGPGLFGDLETRAPDGGAREAYRVLARKYRPATFEDLVGQEAMVRTLSNAFDTGRIAHAFLLTGVRGIGKTTTARIIARALNCVGPDGRGGPTIAPCGVCEPCRAIAASRHIDVLEMDAASRTGINDIRELIDGVNYLPASARYKIYIIDEVHMLSTAAFNGLLKTLEEPPPHVKFVFATTELRKIPVTVLSRCQRFDLKRLDQTAMAAHLGRIAAREAIPIDAAALAMLARAAEGSVRDGMSLLDQAIAHGGARIDADTVRDMLGLSDRTRIFDLFAQIMGGEVAAALSELRAQYDAGADPQTVVRDLLDLVHFLTRVKIVPEAAEDPSLADGERERARDLSARLTMPTLARAWQMLLKGFAEVRDAPTPIAAAEMLIVRLAYAADLPNPADLVRQLKDGAAPAARAPTGPAPPSGGGAPRLAASGGSAFGGSASGGSAPARAAAPPAPTQAAPGHAAPVLAETALTSFEALADLAGAQRDLRLKYQIENNLHPVRIEPGLIEFRPTPLAPANLAAELAERLTRWTGRRWMVSISNEPGEPTLVDRRRDREAAEREAVRDHPLIASALTAFPGAEIIEVRDIALTEAPPAPVVSTRAREDDDGDETEGSIDPYEDVEDLE